MLRSILALLVQAARLGLVAPLALSVGCFYDSTWGARKTAQQHNFALASPSALGPRTETSAPVALGRADATELHVRVHAAPSYVAQTPDWRVHVGALLEQASAPLQAAVGAHLVLETADDWQHAAATHLDVDLAALRDEDTGDGADLVIGLVGGLAMATQDFEQVGLSEVGGKHLVVRAPNVAIEYEAVEKAFDELSADARARLRRERIRHREVAVLLHEIGHALGAEHDSVAGSLMRPAYDAKMSAFDPDSAARMRDRLAHGAAPVKPAAVVRSHVPTPQPPKKSEAPTDLSAPDGELWRRASDLSSAGDAKGAWEAARPLFPRYPLVYGVQDLRCKLAMAHFASYADVRAECDALMKLTMKGAKSP